MARVWVPRKGYVGEIEMTPHEAATGVYGLEGLTREWVPREGYVFKSDKYPGGVPGYIGRAYVGVPPSAASTARALTGEFGSHAQAAAMLISSGVPAITAGNAIRDPKRVKEILGGKAASRSVGDTASGSSAFGGNLFGGRISGSSGGGGAMSGGTGGGSALDTTISELGGGITNTITSYLPLAIKVVVAIVVVKIALSLIGGRK